MTVTLMDKLNVLIDRYFNAYINAPVKWGQRVFGQQLPTKSDVRKGFLKDLNMIAELAQLTGDKEVINKIKCVVDDNFEAELKALKGTLGKD